MNLANKITIFRVLLIPFFIASILYYAPEREYLRLAALSIFLIAMLTDAIDGGIARKDKNITELGKIMDPIADKLLIISAFISLSAVKNIPNSIRIPAWIALAVISRDTIIVIGSLVIYLLKGKLNIRPSWLGKATTFFQMLAILVILMAPAYGAIALYPAVIFTILSGMDYIWRGSRQLNDDATH